MTDQGKTPEAKISDATGGQSAFGALLLLGGAFSAVLFLIFGFIPATSGFGTTMLGLSILLFIGAIVSAVRTQGAAKWPSIVGMILVILLCFAPTPYSIAQDQAEIAAANAEKAEKREAAEEKLAAEKERKEEAAKKEAERKETARIAAMEASNPRSDPKAANSEALDVLEKLAVKGRAPKTGYDRDDQFGTAWLDVDHNGCDTRNDILKRDLKEETFEANNCVVLAGKLNEPYTAKLINFQRGQSTSSAVQIDHVVALSDAWQKGAQQLTLDQRKNFANDPYNLLAVDGPANAQKSDSDAASWLPANKSYRCEYVARQIGVKSKYSLWVTDAEKTAMKSVLGGCPGQTIPAGGGANVEVAQPEPVQQATPQPAQPTPQPAQPTQPAPQPAQPAPAAPAPTSTYYKNCTAVRAAGADPIYAGQPGYGTHLDRDGDGIGCEK